MKHSTSSTSDAIAVKIATINRLMLIGVVFLSGCHPKSHCFEPEVCHYPSALQGTSLSSLFEPLSQKEMRQEWARELHMGTKFAQEGDYYRAITCFKRARFLIGNEPSDRKNQIDWNIVLSYYMGQKYAETILAFQSSNLAEVDSSFPPFRDLILVLHDSYLKTGDEEKACKLLELFEKGDPEGACKLKISKALSSGKLQEALSLNPCDEELIAFKNAFCCCYKSVKKAQILNGVLPGAGYYYVGQKKAALTSFTINALFIAAATKFFLDGNWGAGLITTSLEMGWYFGGINGAGLAAKEFNERVYSRSVQPLMERKRLFPILMLETSF